MRSGADLRQVAPLRAIRRRAPDRGSPGFAALRRGSPARESHRSHRAAWESQRRSHTRAVWSGSSPQHGSSEAYDHASLPGLAPSLVLPTHPGPPAPIYLLEQRRRRRLSRAEGLTPSEASGLTAGRPAELRRPQPELAAAEGRRPLLREEPRPSRTCRRRVDECCWPVNRPQGRLTEWHGMQSPAGAAAPCCRWRVEAKAGPTNARTLGFRPRQEHEALSARRLLCLEAEDGRWRRRSGLHGVVA
jgi:hypothetical protein